MSATAPTAMPAIAPAESIEEVVVDVFGDGAEEIAGEAAAVDWLDVVVLALLLVVLLVVLVLEVLVELELILELEG